MTATIPAGQANGTQSVISLTALTRNATTLTALTQDTNTQGGVENVFADAATTPNGSGTDPGQTARDATAFAYGAYRVAAAILSVSKIATPICDPFNGSTSPKNIPGAYVQYAITITNAAGAASATLSTISDLLETANLTFDPALISGAGAGTNCVAGAQSLSASGFGAIRGAGVTTAYAAPGAALNATTAGATITGSTITINFTTLASTSYGVANAIIAPNSYITVYFNAFVK